jgi:hypothetical protein
LSSGSIYQAACGKARGALEFIDAFPRQTQSFRAAHRKALLDGVLFEIFFDSKARRRARNKDDCFFPVFDLQKFATFAESFDFIASALMAAGGDYYTVPAKNHPVSVSVRTTTINDMPLVDSIYLGSIDILRGEEDGKADVSGIRKIAVDPRQFERDIAKQLIVSRHLLTVSYSPPAAASTEYLRIRCDWTVCKP